ncbi:MAG: hypothetical protein CMN30_02625 [Sandaracinus sp.]|nr:hypothetical protein [Sandaracinus sp.]
MKRSLTLTFVAAMLAATVGCDEEPAIDRVGVNVVNKSLFTGSWYFSRVVIDVDYEAAGIGTYPGDAAIDFASAGLGSMPRVRWVIDEDTLFAYRDYELLEGVNGDEEVDITHPVAAWNIESHFDIRRDYNPLTGEERNVIVENATDRRWYERDYMRVDWSKNQLPGYYGQIANLYEIIGLYNREPADIYVQDASQFPDSWQPTFDFMGCAGEDDTNCSTVDQDYAHDYEQGELYHFSFVTQELLSPGNVTNPFTGRPVNWCLSPYSDAPDCVTTAVYVRNSFLRADSDRQYEPVNWVDSRFERHGYFRQERQVIDRSTSATDPAFLATDFMNYNANRQNLWWDWHDADGNALPYSERRVRPQVWYLTPELPAHLVEPSFDLVNRWNEVFMGTARRLRGQETPTYPDVSCQTENPDGYCFCTEDPETGAILNPTCSGGWDPFQTPEQNAAAGVTNPYQCWVDTSEVVAVDMNDPGLEDEDFYSWFTANMQGDECAVILRENDCNRLTLADVTVGDGEAGRDEPACQERGDIRYKFLSYVDQPGTRFLGVATLRGDPISGEIIAGDANIGGPALDGYRTSALQAYDLINGTIDPRTFVIGEDIRGYMENVDRIEQPAIPRERFITGSVANPANDVVSPIVSRRMEQFMERAEQLAGPEGRANVFSERLDSLRGTSTERRLMENLETVAMAGIDVLPEGFGPGDISDEILDKVSPFRISASERLAYQREVETKISSANVMMPNEFTDASVLEFVNRHRDWPRARLEIGLNQLLYYQTQLHEMGHCMGLRHDFGASADTGNYDDDYYHIHEAIPYPDIRDYDRDGVEGFSPDEQLAWQEAYEAVKERRELAGVDRWMNSSIMEYTAQWYERTVTGARGAGRYDHAAINDAYGDLTEIYDNSAGREMSEITPVNTERRWIKYYHGGQACEVDTDCPYSAGGSRAAELLPGNTESGLTQTCQPHPDGVVNGSFCSNTDGDQARAIAGVAAPRWAPVHYRFCTDDRVGTYAWCHRFDEGDSYREVVRNIAEQYDRQYIFTNFRRYRRTFSLGGYLFNRLIGRQYNILQAIQQNLIYKYANEPEYRNTTGAFEFEDQFMATADMMNFYAKVMFQPPIGAYTWNEGWQRYENTSVLTETPGASLALPLGMARYSSSEYQRGLTGIQRIELVGSFYEKWFTMQMLTERGYVSEYSRDVPFWTNFYDLFPDEMQQIFQGMIGNQPERVAPRVRCGSGTFPRCTDPTLVYLNFFRGDCTDLDNPDDCAPPSDEVYASLPVVDSDSNVTLQFLGALFSLAEFPTFFDTSYQNQLFLCTVGEGACPEPSATMVEGVDYIDYTSDFYGKTFRAFDVDEPQSVDDEKGIAFQLIQEASTNGCLLDAIRTYRGDFEPTLVDPSTSYLTVEQQQCITDQGYTLPPFTTDADLAEIDDEVDRILGRQTDLESFFFQLQHLLADYDVASYLRF